jgi:hypothetical protein
VLGTQTLRDLSRLIQCVVEKSEKRFYNEEMQEIKEDI